MLEAGAFPAALAGTVAQLLPALGSSQAHPPFAVCQDGEALLIPTRTYYDRLRLLACTQLPGDAGVIALCLGTRHHDGHLREACLKQLLLQERAWTVPFVVHLCGEYVLEIVERIGAALPAWNAQALARYLRENPAYMDTLERRAVSYWNGYYRGRYPAWDDYPGCRAMAALRALQRLTPR
ncbi:hypothetical protein OX459_22480 [Janthinobacterium sp. SUN026]|uniref:hypothetical protein n=1 Tax=Janthinobacterium sp. SUN026 TaxID=3002438 RepID=UPI0025B0113D|nr:hypothetical protein [Janthinobacterium sp. SUN026]MDN2674168.1 hypothetical protein [Janthinobacterium sp. SUN026]